MNLQEFKEHQQANTDVYKDKVKQTAKNIITSKWYPKSINFGDYQPEDVENMFGRSNDELSGFRRDLWLHHVDVQIKEFKRIKLTFNSIA